MSVKVESNRRIQDFFYIILMEKHTYLNTEELVNKLFELKDKLINEKPRGKERLNLLDEITDIETRIRERKQEY